MNLLEQQVIFDIWKDDCELRSYGNIAIERDGYFCKSDKNYRGSCMLSTCPNMKEAKITIMKKKSDELTS